MLTPQELAALERRIHVHTNACYGMYEPCGEHHAHDDKCGSRPLCCGRSERAEVTAYELRALCDMAKQLLETLSRTRSGHNELCYYCRKPCDAMASDPLRRPVGLLLYGEDEMTWHHMDCLIQRVE